MTKNPDTAMANTDLINQILPESIRLSSFVYHTNITPRGSAKLLDIGLSAEAKLFDKDKNLINTTRVENLNLLTPISTEATLRELAFKVNGKKIKQSDIFEKRANLKKKSEQLSRLIEDFNFNENIQPLIREWSHLKGCLDTDKSAHITFGDVFCTFDPKIAAYAEKLLNKRREFSSISVDPKKLDQRPKLLKLLPSKKAQQQNQEDAELLKNHIEKMVKIEKTLEKVMPFFPVFTPTDTQYTEKVSDFMKQNKENRPVTLPKLVQSMKDIISEAVIIASFENAIPKALLRSDIDAHRLAMQTVDEEGHKVSPLAKLRERLDKHAKGESVPDIERVSRTDIYGRGNDKNNDFVMQELRKRKTKTN